MKHSFGNNLESMMKKKNFSARSLSKQINVPYKTVQEWIGSTGRMPRDPEVLRKLADIFNCTVYYLLYGEEDPKTLIGEILERTEIHTGLYEITIKKVKKIK